MLNPCSITMATPKDAHPYTACLSAKASTSNAATVTAAPSKNKAFKHNIQKSFRRKLSSTDVATQRQQLHTEQDSQWINKRHTGSARVSCADHASALLSKRCCVHLQDSSQSSMPTSASEGLDISQLTRAASRYPRVDSQGEILSADAVKLRGMHAAQYHKTSIEAMLHSRHAGATPYRTVLGDVSVCVLFVCQMWVWGVSGFTAR